MCQVKDAKDAQESNNFYPEVIFKKSFTNLLRDHNSNELIKETQTNKTFTDVTAPISLTFTGVG